MESSSKDATKEPVGFFAALHRLGRQIDEGVKNAQKQLNDRHLDCGSSKHTALKSLLDCKKDLNTMKPISRSMVKELREKGKRFDESLQACSEVIDLQLQQLSAVQAHLTQYGFVLQPEGEDSAEDDTQDSEAEKMECANTPPQESGAGEGKVEKKANLTPRLEDFGVSSYTLNMLNRPTQPPPARLQQTRTRSEAPQHDSVPDMFKNEGLTVTPSLFPSKPYGTGNSSACDVFSLAYSPDPEPQDSTEMEGDLAEGSRAVAMTLDFSDSPVPPVLHTPGIKQIPRSAGVVPPHPPPGQRGPVARQLKLGGSVADPGLDSPIPPVLSTPGIHQIGSKATAPPSTAAPHPSQAPVGGYDPLEVPKTPEFTYSLRDLEDLTVSFRQTELTSTFSERPATASSSHLDLSRAPLSSAHHAGRGPPLPPTVSWSNAHAAAPTLHDPVVSGHARSGHVMAGLAVSEPQLSSWSRGGGGGGGGGSLDLPPSPELTMSYTAGPRVSADSSSLSSLQQPHSRCGEENWRQREEESHGGRGLPLSSAPHPASLYHHPGAFPHREEPEPFEKRTGVPHKQSGFGSAHLSSSGSSVRDMGRGVLSSTENIASSRRSGASGKAEGVVKDSAWPHQPVLRHPLSEGGLDLPATPKFFGSYHFMGARH